MKKTLLYAALFLALSTTALAQAPQSFNYQGVARNTSGTPLAGATLGLRLTVHDGSPGGTVLYQETQAPVTNSFGLYNIAVGSGTVVSGTIASISWGSGAKYLQVEIDPAGGTSYIAAGTSQLLSVPYAVYANTANSANTANNATTATTATSISGTVPMGGDVSGTNTAATVTKIQGESISATPPTAGQVLTWNTGSSSWVPTTPSSGSSYTAGTGINVAGSVISAQNTTALWNANSLEGHSVSATVPTSGQVLTWNTGTSSWTPTTPSSGTTYTAGTGIGISGTIISAQNTTALWNANSLQGTNVSTTAPTSGQLLQYTGSAWAPATVSIPSVAGTANYVPKFTSATALGNSMIFDNGTTVGVNTTTPTSMAKMHVSGVGTYGSLPYYQAGIVADGGGASANASGVYGEGGWRGVFGRNPGTSTGTEAIGVLGRVEGSSYTGTGFGVKGECVGTGGTANYGVYGTASGAGIGVAGIATGTGAAGKFDGGSTGLGIIVPNGRSGFGTATPPTSAKVEVVGVGAFSGTAPYSQAGLVADGATTGSASGIYGEGGWRGIYGNNLGTAGGYAAVGVQGNCDGSAYTVGYGIYGSSVGTGPTNVGVLGTAVDGVVNYAGYFTGNIYAVSASSSIKSFRIDDPRDPANKYLCHSSVESNEMMDLYKGSVTTDASGDAVVTLPSYFVMLNKSYDYQLTCIGQFAQAIVAEEISSNNQFKIKTDKPNVKVSWMVSGVRQDPAANTYRVKDEVEKPGPEKGTYLMPELYGFGREKGTNYMDQSHGNKPANGTR